MVNKLILPNKQGGSLSFVFIIPACQSCLDLPRKENMLKPHFFEAKRTDELEKPTSIQVGVRIFNVGLWSEKADSNMRSALSRVVAMAEETMNKGIELVIISNDDIAPEGRDLLKQTGVKVLYSPSQKVKRRAALARALVKGAAPAGTFSYADMLETLTKNEEATPLVGFMSSDLVTPEGFKNMKAAVWVYEKFGGLNCYIVGPAVQGVHDINAVEQVIKGEVIIDLSVLWRMFPNNALSMVGKGAKFSGIMDNGNAGKIILPNGKETAIGGNEEFVEFLRRSITAWNPRKSSQPPYAILVVEPNMVRKREAEWPAHEEKYSRRSEIYAMATRRYLHLAWRRQTGVFAEGGDLHGLRYHEIFDEAGKPHPQIVHELMSRRLFFCKSNRQRT